MSSSLYYRRAQALPPREGGVKLPLKGILVRRFWDPTADGTLTYQDVRYMSLEDDGEWLKGVIDAASADLRLQAEEIQRALHTHGQIAIWVE